MAKHNVILNYGEKGVLPDPPTIFVRKGDCISFQPGAGVGAGAKTRITIRDADCFSAARHDDGEPDIVVVADLPAETTYECDLVVNGEVLPRWPGSAGGGMKPGSDDIPPSEDV